MRRSPFVLLGLDVSVVCVLLVALAAMAQAQSAPASASGAQVRRLIFVSAGFDENNRFWTIGRPSHLVKIFSYTSPGEAEHPQVAEALAIYFGAVGIKATIEDIDEGKLAGLWREKAQHCCIWSNIIGLRPTEEWVRTSYTSKGLAHHFEDAFIEKKYQELTQTVDPQERQRIAREIGDHLFEETADIPMGVFANEVMVNPKVVAEWLYPGPGAGRSTHFHMIKAAP